MHCVAPAVGQPLLQLPHAVALAQKPPAQLVGALHARQPLASATQVLSCPLAH
jgi:hypothetical protein